MSPSCRQSRAAFTLLEVLVAMAMVAVLAGSLYASLQIGFRAREKAEASLEGIRVSGIALDLMRRDLECAPAPRGILAGTFVGQPARVGDASAEGASLVFYSRAANALDAAPGIVRVEFAVAAPANETATEPALLRRMTVNLLAPSTPVPIEEVLARNVAFFSINYFDGSTWFDSWDSTTQNDSLPMAVEVLL
jgi:prepilin-type N-terminal cleavage/methylation domain-containing protein